MKDYNYRHDVNDAMREARWTIGKFFFCVFLPIFLLFSIAGGVWHFLGKPVEVLDQVTDPTRMIAQYEWFIQQDKDIKKMDPQIADAQAAVDRFESKNGDASKYTFFQQNEDSRLSSVVLGLKQQRQGMVADYNSRSDQRTRSFLKEHNLPDHYE